MKQINQAPRYVYFPEVQYTHPDTKLCINTIQTHRTEAKQRHILIKRVITKERPTGPKDKQLTKENYTAEAKGHKMAKDKSQLVCL